MAGAVDTAMSAVSSASSGLTKILGDTFPWARNFIDKYAMWILGIIGLSILVKGFGIKIKV